MSLQEIRLELARDPDFPEGSANRGYEFVAPLDVMGHIDPAEWRRQRRRCWVRRFWQGEPEEHGHLVRTRGGAWAFHYDIESEVEPDEPGYRFDDHVFRRDEYVSIREHDGTMRTFRVARVRPIG